MAGAGRKTMVGLIRAYQLTLSALVGRQCRYLPTCSDYAAEAIARHGPWVGSWMAGARLCRCRPFGGWGYDPVPRRCEAVPRARPWRHGVWRIPAVPVLAEDDQDRARSCAAKP
jgi:putative membrane protein insertion efficiency factor